jgi:hypothetical protein
MTAGLLLVALAGCGGDSGTNPGPISTPTPPFTGPVTGSYDLVIVPAAACGFPAGPYQFAMVAQQLAQTGSPGTTNLRVTLANGDYNVALEMQFPTPGVVRGSIATQQAALLNENLAIYLRGVGTGTESAASGGRGEILDGTMVGDVRVYVNDLVVGTCTSADHRWSLRAR